MEMPELYDLRVGSGVVPREDGVILFRGIIEGDGANGCPAEEGCSGCGLGGVKGTEGRLGIIDILFNLRASVGLIVRAARPVAWALFGIIDNLLLDDGVVVLRNAGRAGGDLGVLGIEIVWSDIPIGVET